MRPVFSFSGKFFMRSVNKNAIASLNIQKYYGI